MRYCTIILCILLFNNLSYSQSTDTVSIPAQQNDPLQSIQNISSKSLDFVNNKYSKITNSIQSQSEKLVKRMQEKEAKLQRKLQSIDSSKAKELFSDTKEKYQELQTKLQSSVDKTIRNPLNEYIPGLDSIGTLTKFLSQNNINIPALPADKLQQVQALSSQLQELQTKLQTANNIQSFIKEREAQLKASLANTGLGKELLGLNKEVFYYQQRLTEYKELLYDKKKLEDKLLATVRDLPAFQRFMQKNSYLAQLFRMPGDYGTPEALIGLQTRVSVQNLLTQSMGSVGGGTNTQQYMQQQIGGAQQQLNTMKDKITKMGGGSSDMAMPDFKPNNQKTKSFLQRMQYGFNIQSQRGNSLLPVMSDIALTLGYKLTDKGVIGIGAAYKLGWGSGLNNIHFTSEGVGLRSYVDIKAKGSIWLTGGFEYNYLQQFNDFSAIKNLDAWQHSALLGLSKKYKVGKKAGNIQLLYDFFAQKQVSQAQALKFRVGYNF